MADSQAEDWGGLSWSAWCAFDEAVHEGQIPSTGGIYRFRSRGEPGLLYIGEGGNRSRRLRTLARMRRRHPAAYYLAWPSGTKRPHRGHYAAPQLRRCDDDGCVVEVSCAIDVHADRAARRSVESRLIRQHFDEVGHEPPCQHGGSGMTAYLAQREYRRPSAT
jgi:hypothetical protein